MTSSWRQRRDGSWVSVSIYRFGPLYIFWVKFRTNYLLPANRKDRNYSLLHNLLFTSRSIRPLNLIHRSIHSCLGRWLCRCVAATVVVVSVVFVPIQFIFSDSFQEPILIQIQFAHNDIKSQSLPERWYLLFYSFIYLYCKDILRCHNHLEISQ